MALDVDVDDEDAAAAVENAAREALGLGDAAEIPRRIGRYPRVLLPLRCATPFRKIKSAPFRLRSNGSIAQVEVLADGQQFVAYGVHPDTRRPYEWNGSGDLLTVPRDQLPEIDEAKARQVVRACEAVLEEWGDRVSEEPPPGNGDQDDGRQRFATGGRNDALTREAGKLRRLGLSPTEINATLQQMNTERCDPPEERGKVEAIARSIARYPAGEAKAGTQPENLPALPPPATALALLEANMQPIAKLCDPWISEGLCIVAGRPKLGKTTLLRQKLAAVASGGELFGVRCVQATTLFLSLEEGDRLTRTKLAMAGFSDEALANILIYFQWRRGKDGALDLLRALDEYPGVKYVGIDSLTRIRDVPDSRTPAFVCDYEAVSALHTIAKARPGLAIDAVHHTRKVQSQDAIEDISGTYGLTAACDSYWVMRHHADGAVLHVGGRLWESDTTQFQLRRASQRWELEGAFVGTTDVQAETLAALGKAADGMTPSQIAATFGIVKQSAHDRLNQLVARGLAYSEKGTYYARTT